LAVLGRVFSSRPSHAGHGKNRRAFPSLARFEASSSSIVGANVSESVAVAGEELASQGFGGVISPSLSLTDGFESVDFMLFRESAIARRCIVGILPDR